MANLILSKVDSPNPASPLNLVLRKRVVPPYTAAQYAKFAWRFEDSPESSFQLLGQQTVGFPLEVPIDLQGQAIRISMIGVREGGVASQTDWRKGVQIVMTPNELYGIVTHEGEIVVHEGNVVTYNG
jgi:hypothetical protein